LLLQLANPDKQVIAHAPFAQLAVPLLELQMCPQAPQLFGSAPVFTSQPSEGFPLQSAQPWLHAATMHCPLLQPEVALLKVQT
jgi:hypothetical protein